MPPSAPVSPSARANLPYYLHTNPAMVATARCGIGEVLADLA